MASGVSGSQAPRTDRRRRILTKLKEVSDKLAKILAGQNATLADILLPQEKEPGETPMEALQRFRRILGDALAEHDRGEPRVCRRCKAPIPHAELEELPWAAVCRQCTAAPES